MEHIVAAENSSDKSNNLLSSWQKACTDKDSRAFETFLKSIGLDYKRALQLCTPTNSIPNIDKNPKWLDFLEKILSLSKSPDSLLKISSKNISPELAFKEFYIPFIYSGINKLKSSIPKTMMTEFSNLLEQLADHLIKILNFTAYKTLYKEFSIFRACLDPMYLLKKAGAKKNRTKAQNSIYKKFINNITGSEYIKFFEKYPVLARLICEQTLMWVEYSIELLERLYADQKEIFKYFTKKNSKNSKKIPKIKSIEMGLSDSHCYGRTVCLIEFESNLKVIYKPKNTSLEKEFNLFLKSLNSLGLKPKIKALDVLDKTNYSWVEFIEHAQMTSKTKTHDFYQRAGSLMAMVHILKGTDCHQENLIAHGEFPVLIDPEAMLNLGIDYSGQKKELSIDMQMDNHISSSVLNSGFLPYWETSMTGKAYIFSAFGSKTSSGPFIDTLHKNYINTDEMVYSNDFIDMERPEQNLPRLNGEPVDIKHHVNDLETGFKKAYSLILENLDSFQRPGSPLQNLKKSIARFFLRPTTVYLRIILKSLDPGSLKNGINWSISLSHLYRHYAVSSDVPQKNIIFKSEFDSLSRLDIPFFLFNISKKYITTPESIEKVQCLETAPSSIIDNMTENINCKDMNTQLTYIKACMCAYSTKRKNITEKSNAAKTTLLLKNLDETEQISAESAVKEAKNIAQQIIDNAAIDENNTLYWMHMSLDPVIEKFRLMPIDNSLYNGRCGVALFLALLYKKTEYPMYRESVFNVLDPILDISISGKNHPSCYNVSGLGIGTGLGSIVYSFALLYSILREQKFLEISIIFTQSMTKEMVEKDLQMDILGGTAGAILGMIKLFEITGDSDILKKCNDFGTLLLKKRITDKNGFKVWKTQGVKRALTGFSHGAAGYALAYSRLYKITDDEKFRRAANHAVNYENSVFCKEQNNWPDFRNQAGKDSPKKVICRTAWCHGAPGIGLSRLGILDINNKTSKRLFNSNTLLENISSAIKAIDNYPFSGADNLCCGNTGNMDFLIEAAKKMNKPDLLAKAGKLAAFIHKRALSDGMYDLLAKEPGGIFSPGLFQGTAGIGYLFLRIAFDDIPCLPLWE